MKNSMISTALLFIIPLFFVVSCGVSDNSEEIAQSLEKKKCDNNAGFWSDEDSKCYNPCENNPCGDHGKSCKNTDVAAYDCQCDDGYTFDGKKCANTAGSINGVVKDKVTGEPIQKAAIELRIADSGTLAASTSSSSEGYFATPEISEGEYDLLVTKPGYIENKSTVSVVADKQTTYDVQLEKLPAALQILIDGEEKSDLDFGAEIGVVSRQFEIVNKGEENLDWQISYSADWIKEITPDEGSLKAQRTQGVVVIIDRSLLKSGEQTTTISVTSNDGNKEITVKATNATVLPTLNTLEAANITSSTAILQAEILTKGNPSYSERGFVYSLESNPTLEDKLGQLTAKVTDENLYSATVTGLELGEEYYVRGYAINEAGVAYSTNEVKFSPEMGLPEVQTSPILKEDIDLESRTAVFNGAIIEKGDPAYTKRGFVYGLTPNPNVDDDQKKEVPGKTETFSAKISDLEVGKVYYVRAYAEHDDDEGIVLYVAYGKDEKLDFKGTKPEVTTTNVNVISRASGTAIFEGNIDDPGYPAYTKRGFVYNTDHNLTIDPNNVTSAKNIEVPGTDEGSFSINVDELVIGNIYYVRAYAENAQGINYGEEKTLDFLAQAPAVTTNAPDKIDRKAGTARLKGNIVDGDPVYIQRGFVYATVNNPTIDDNNVEVQGTGSGDFSANISGLVLNTVYYVRAYAITPQGITYSEQEATLDMTGTLAELTTDAVGGISIESGTATFNGTIVTEGDPAYTERGFVYGVFHNPTVEDDTKKVATGTGTGAFFVNVTGLSMNKIYYVRAYATNAVGINYGVEVQLDFSAKKPVISTTPVTLKNITAGTATFNGTITSIGDPAYTERGFVYGTVHNPTVEDDTKKVATGTGTGAFSANVTGLSMNKIYYIRAYATSVAGTEYGTEVSADFSAVMPTVTTTAATSIDIAAGTATLNGKINSIGDPAYTERGFVYATIHNPTVEDNTKKVAPGSGTGEFSANASNLSLNTTYYIRAYAKSSQGVSYGNEVTLNFKGTLATVKTSTATNVSIASKTATFNGSIESVGDPAYTERGFVYGLTHNPNIVDDTKKTASGSGTGAFSASVTNLTMNKTYYIRAYATNLQGTAYGSEVALDFSQVFPVVTTQEASGLGEGTATFNGTIESVGDPAYTERGFIYGKMPVPTIDDTGTVTIIASGSGTGAYARTVSNLEKGATYYVRAYAKVGTVVVYGKIVSFVADIPPYVVLSTGLIVARENAGRLNWNDARDMCANSNLAGFTDWRLPTKDELILIYNNRTLIGNFETGYSYWSSTQVGTANYYYCVDFYNGSVSDVYYGNSRYLRCVR